MKTKSIILKQAWTQDEAQKEYFVNDAIFRAIERILEQFERIEKKLEQTLK